MSFGLCNYNRLNIMELKKLFTVRLTDIKTNQIFYLRSAKVYRLNPNQLTENLDKAVPFRSKNYAETYLNSYYNWIKNGLEYEAAHNPSSTYYAEQNATFAQYKIEIMENIIVPREIFEYVPNRDQ